MDDAQDSELIAKFMNTLESVINDFGRAVTDTELMIIAHSPSGFIQKWNLAMEYQSSVRQSLATAREVPQIDLTKLIELEKRHVADLKRLSSQRELARLLLGVVWKDYKSE